MLSELMSIPHTHDPGFTLGQSTFPSVQMNRLLCLLKVRHQGYLHYERDRAIIS